MTSARISFYPTGALRGSEWVISNVPDAEGRIMSAALAERLERLVNAEQEIATVLDDVERVLEDTVYDALLRRVRAVRSKVST